MIIFVIFWHVPLCKRVVIELIWSYMFFYMNVNKWTQYCHCVILGLRWGHVIVYCTSWVLDRVPLTNETFSNFVKSWISVNGTQWRDIELPDIHKLSEG